MTKTIILLIIAFVALMVFNFLVKALWRVRKDGWGAFWGKLKSAGQGPRVDADAHYTEEELRKFSLGNLYVYQQQGTLNTTFATGVLNNVRETILYSYFSIKDHTSAVETLQWLASAPSQTAFHYVYEAFLQGKEGKKWLRAHEELKDHSNFVDDCVEKLENLQNNFEYLVSEGIVASQEDMGRIGVLAWDAGRLNFIARLCHEQGFIDKDLCQQCVDVAYEMTKDAYTGWKDYVYSYVLGRTLSMGSANMSGLAKELLEKPESPWSYVKW